MTTIKWYFPGGRPGEVVCVVSILRRSEGGWCFANPARAKTIIMEAFLINDLMYIRRAMLKTLHKNEIENGALKEQILALEYHLNKLQPN